MQAALDYMGLVAGTPLDQTKIDWVFIGSCTNSRMSDLRDAAKIAKGRKVASHVRAWVVPGSENIKREAEAEGLHTIFLDAGFDLEESEMRATATFAAGIGFLHLSGSRPSPMAAGRRGQFLEVMLRH